MRTPMAFLLAGVVLLAGCRDEPAPDPILDAPADTPADTLTDDPLAPGPVPVHPDAGVQEGADGVDRDREASPAAPGTDAGAAAPGDRLFTVQVAAFRNPDSAELWTRRLGEAGFPVWTSVAEIGGHTFYRVRVGAAESTAEARRLGESLTQRYNWPVWVAPVTPVDRPPRGAVEQTQRLMAAR
jgi:cell division septation protein DedD